MAIESIVTRTQNEQNPNLPTVGSVQDILQSNRILMAGTQKIRHPLVENAMVLYGFIGEIDEEYLSSKLEVNGLNIRFNDSTSRTDSFTRYYKIYTKIFIDLKRSPFYDLFPQLTLLKEYGDTNSGQNWKVKRNGELNTKCNYYFFDNNNDLNPDVHSDILYLICKFREDGEFKYCLFLPHEVIIV
jgi:hypothetical protein